MKIAILGHPTRGKEVIQILESLGGRNAFNYNGDFIRTAYFIGMDYSIYGFCADSPKVGFKVYNLEAFETQFPFKIGDTVLLKGVNKPYEIIALEWYMNKLCYKLDNGLHYAPGTLTTYKEMQEERNIKLTLNKAKEWYKKGGELKEIALQAFTEEELTKVDLPKTWEEFCENHMINNNEAYFDTCGTIYSADITGRDSIHDKNMCPSKKSAEAHLAMMQLEQLRDCWRQGWEPIWGLSQKWCIRLFNGVPSIGITANISTFLTFPTKEMAEEFLECFRDLIEKAGDLI